MNYPDKKLWGWAYTAAEAIHPIYRENDWRWFVRDAPTDVKEVPSPERIAASICSMVETMEDNDTRSVSSGRLTVAKAYDEEGRFMDYAVSVDIDVDLIRSSVPSATPDPMARQLVEAEVETAAEAIQAIPWCTPAMHANADHIARAVLGTFFDVADTGPGDGDERHGAQGEPETGPRAFVPSETPLSPSPDAGAVCAYRWATSDEETQHECVKRGHHGVHTCDCGAERYSEKQSAPDVGTPACPTCGRSG